MHFAQRNADGPLVIAEISYTVHNQVKALSDSHACSPHEKESRGFEIAPLAELDTEAKIILR